MKVLEGLTEGSDRTTLKQRSGRIRTALQKDLVALACKGHLPRLEAKRLSEKSW